MKVLVMLTGLLLSCDAWSSNNDLNIRPQSAPIFYVLPQISPLERLMAAQQMSRQQTPIQGVVRTRLTQPPTRFPNFSTVQAHTQNFNPQHSGESSEIRIQPVRRQRIPTTYPSFTTTTGHTNTHNTNHQQGTVSGFSQTQRPTVVNHGASGHNFPSTTSITSHASTAPASSGSFGGQNTGIYDPTVQPQAPTTPPPTHKPSVVQGHKDSTTWQTQKPSSVGHEGNIHTVNRQDSKPSKVDPLASQRNPACYHTPDFGTCRAALPRYYFDQETGTCNCFLYGGCSEHGKPEGPGNFITLEECLHECRPPKVEEGPYCKVVFKDDHFQSFLHVDNTPSQTRPVDLSHLSDKKLIASFST